MIVAPLLSRMMIDSGGAVAIEEEKVKIEIELQVNEIAKRF